MNEDKNWLESEELRKQVFRTPEGYFESLEDRVMARIKAEEEEAVAPRRPLWRILKPTLALAATFAIIFGMGYGVLSLTHTLKRGAPVPATEYATVEEEFIQPASLMNYYQMEIPVEEETDIDEETLVNYLAASMSFADLTDIYAQNY